MASEGMGMVPTQRLENGLNPRLVFQDEGIRFGRVGDPGPKTRELAGFIDDRYFQPQSSSDFRRCIYGSDTRSGRSGDGSEGDEEEEEDDDDEEEDDEVDGRDVEVEALVGVNDSNNRNNNDNNSNSEHGHGDAIGNGKSKHLSYVGASRGFMSKQGNFLQPGNDNSSVRANSNDDHQRGPVNQYQNAVTIADPDGDLYYSQYLQGPEGSGCGQKGVVVENGCGFSGRKDSSYSSEYGESLRVILSDPLTGGLMDDAMILPCGHSFGGGGMQHVIRMKACYTCSQPISEESVSPNLSLRAAVQAFRQEEELQVYRSSKRRRERFEQDKGSFVDSMSMDHPRGRGVQFPFAVTDRVVIKGNKRTPQRFVGREAIVTTQCLNGWYVVKTLDNAESVKLQYRSLAKVSDNPSLKTATCKMIPN
ncbi:U-box domain-containing protein 62-like isoform X1 [Actinidia eriantha]|uniref:U-box domain-containing protein 62-like isoform X1 n=1 Tax=Actinidia eriantha TaxID=165200 RepID=UPI002588F102|nr:U-box domain-containing protein 62-like isoform X1 [Actinidia eriantha]